MTKKQIRSIYDKSVSGKAAVKYPNVDVPLQPELPEIQRRTQAIGLPELSELEVIRHYTKLSHENFSIDGEFYPLGSCTMKYNPKINEVVASHPSFSYIHPYQKEESTQGMLHILFEMQTMLGEITGLPAVTLQPAAGAHGEYVGVRIVRDYFKKTNEPRKYILIPESAHGTNPSSAALSGFSILVVKTTREGVVDLHDLSQKVETYGKEIACIMLTNPNTLGLFEKDILKISQMLHKNGSLLYYDGANLNAIVGIVRPGDMGFDIIHLNLHKTFSTPHGGGGPGSGPVCVSQRLSDFLPNPMVVKSNQTYRVQWDHKTSIGRVRTFYGNAMIILRAYAYILAMGKEHIHNIAEIAVLNANYLKEKLKSLFPVYVDQPCMHEFVCSLASPFFREKHVRTMDIAKRLIDYGIHPPTVYFPINVSEAMMIEPTETESKEVLDQFVDVMTAIYHEIETNPELVIHAPHSSRGGRMNEVKAVKEPKLVH